MKEILPRIEISTRPWFGPRKRAKKHLIARKILLTPKSAWKEFSRILGPSSTSVQSLRFIDFTNKNDHFRYTILLVWTFSSCKVRDAIYDLATEIVSATGWYPLPQGERIGSRLAISSQWNSVLGKSSFPSINIQGGIQSISSAVQANGGCSVRVKAEDGNAILLDAGLPGHLYLSASDKAVFISHLHLDHLGGLKNSSHNDIPVILPRRTAHILLAQNRLDYNLNYSTICPEDGWKCLGEQLEIMSFQTPHIPGSAGYVIRDKERAIIYTGDIVLRTARHDFTPQIYGLLDLVSPRKTTLLIDATMAARTAGASGTDTAQALLSKFTNSDDLIILSHDMAHLLYAYLDLFHVVKENTIFRHNVDFLATPLLKSIFHVVHAAFIGRELNALDPILASQYGKSMSAWAESKFLYWINSNAVLPHGRNRKRIWLLTPSELKSQKTLANAFTAPIGRFTDQEISMLKILSLDTSPWTSHSNSETLRTVLPGIAERACVVLFHDYPKRLQKFVRNSGIATQVLTKKEILIK